MQGTSTRFVSGGRHDDGGHAVQPDLDGMARGRAGEVGGLGVGERERQTGDVGRREHGRVGQDEMIVHHDAGGNQDQPAP